MAYKSKDLSVLAYANGFTLWHYATTDDGAAVAGANYFDEAADMLRVGDLVIANTDTDGAPGAVFYRVSGTSGGVVAVAVV
jgi:hypothetical protein